MTKKISTVLVAFLISMAIFFLVNAISHISKSYSLIQNRKGDMIETLEAIYTSSLDMITGIFELVMFGVLICLVLEVIEKNLFEHYL
jgi:hypothetical protein